MTKTAKKSVVKTSETTWDRMSMAERLSLFEKIEKNAPKNVPLTDEEIQEEVNMVRYGNKDGKLNRNWERDLALLALAKENDADFLLTGDKELWAFTTGLCLYLKN